jgi:hypothetical protein
MSKVIRVPVLFFMCLVTTLGVGSPGSLAQSGTDSPFSDLGLPEIAVEINDTEILGAPSELAAGRYVLTVTNSSPTEDLGVGFIQPPPDMTAAQFIEFVSSGPPAGAEAATPAGQEQEQEGGEGPPAFYYEVPIAGGIYAEPGTTTSTVLDLNAGEWVLWAEDPAAPQKPVPLVVTGEAPANQPEPTADATITGLEMSFTVEGELAAGPQVIKFVNGGEQPHFLLMLKVPDGTTVDDFLALSATFDNPSATPPGNLSFEDVVASVNTADQSGGTTTWISADLDAGTYILACFVPDPETGAPHAMLGMIDTVIVP